MTKYAPQRVAAALARRFRWRTAEELAVAKARFGSKRDLTWVFGHVDDESWFVLNTRGYRRSRVLKDILPSMPDATLQQRYIGNSGDSALHEAWQAYCLWRELAARNGRPIRVDSNVLDFGCGWGRT